MKTIIAIFFLLPMTIADSNPDGVLDPHHDKTEHYINEIFAIAQSLDHSKLRDSFQKFSSLHDTSKTPELPSVKTNLSTVTFSKFVPFEDILSASTVERIECSFGDLLVIQFQMKFAFILEGSVQFREAGNSSSCQTDFRFNISKAVGYYYFQKRIDEIAWYHSLPSNEEMPIVTPSIKLCENISEYQNYQRSFVFRLFLLGAFQDVTGERYSFLFKSLYQKMFNKCLNSQIGIYDTKKDDRNDYVRFEPIRKLVGIPWISDYHELIIKGIGNLLTAVIRNESQCRFYVPRVEIRWNIVSLASQQYYNIEAYGFYIHINNSNLVDNLRVDFVNAFKLTSINEEPLDTNTQENLKKLIANGIKETYLKTISVTKDFTNIIRKILLPFNKNTFKNTFVDFKIADSKTFISFSNIEIEDLHIGDVTCVDKNLNVSTIKYKKIRGHVEYWYSTEKSNDFRAPDSVNVSLTDVEIHILLKPHPNGSNEVIIQMEDNLNMTDTAIMIESKNHRLSREERISIGLEIWNRFVGAFRERIMNVTSSTFHPMLDACKNLQYSSDEPQANNFSDRNRYFAVIRNFRMNSVNSFSTQQIDLTVKGSWNIKDISLRYQNESVILDGLRIENVTGNIKIRQIDDSNETHTFNYSMNYFSLIINHSDYNIRIQIPPYSEYSINCVTSNISMCDKNRADVIENFQLTVASYIEQSIYNDSDYRDARFQKAQENILALVQEEAPLEYDASSIFSFWLFKSLMTWQLRLFHLTTNVGRGDFTSDGYYFYEQSINRFRAIIKEEICDHFNHSTGEQMCITIQFNSSETVQMELIDVISVKAVVKMKKRCAMDALVKEYNEALQFDVDPESIQIKLSQNNTFDTTKLVNSTISSFEEHVDDYRKVTACISCFRTLILSKKHFYLIEDNVTLSHGSSLTYHIRLYGMDNLKSFHNDIMVTYGNKFELTIANLTAHIIWIQNIGGLASKIPEKIILKIDKITLAGEAIMEKNENRLLFTNGSQVQISAQKDSKMTEKLTETLGSIILNAIKRKLRDTYYRIINKSSLRDFPDTDPNPDFPKGHFLK